MNKAQDAYGQGMSQFTPFNARQDGQAYLEQARAKRMASQPQQPVAQPTTNAGLYIDNKGRIVDNTDQQSMLDYLALISGRDGANPYKYMGVQEEQLRLDPTKLGLRSLSGMGLSSNVGSFSPKTR